MTTSTSLDREPIVTPYSELTPEPVEWLVPGRIPAGMLTLLDGDPGQGKSFLTLDLAARLSTGRAFPDCDPAPPPADTVLLTAEDSRRRTIRPRLEAAGAVVARVHDFRVRVGGVKLPPVLPRDLDILAATIRKYDARLVVIDPFLAFLSASVFNHHFVRQVLGQLAHLADETRAAILLVRHLTKGGRGHRAIYRGTGAMAILGAARTAFLAGPHPDDHELYLLAATKCNLTAPPPTLAFRVLDEPAGHARIDWLGPTPHSADDIVLTPAALPAEAPRPAVAFLQDLLRAGPLPRDRIISLGRAQDLSQRTLERAKAELNIHSSVQHEHGHNVWHWSLPRPSDPADTPHDLFGLAATQDPEPTTDPCQEEEPPDSSLQPR